MLFLFLALFLIILPVYLKVDLIVTIQKLDNRYNIYVQLMILRLKREFYHMVEPRSLQVLNRFMHRADVKEAYYKQVIRQLAQKYDLFNFVLRFLIVEKLDWKSIIGFDDAGYTAISAGSLWVLKGCILGVLSSKTRINKVNIEVTPDFCASTKKTELICILKMRLVHIIRIVIYVLFLKVRGYWHGYTTAAREQPSH